MELTTDPSPEATLLATFDGKAVVTGIGAEETWFWREEMTEAMLDATPVGRAELLRREEISELMALGLAVGRAEAKELKSEARELMT